MNKKTLKFLKTAFWGLMFDGLLLGYAGLIPGTQTAAAQTILTTTTLSAAVADSSAQRITLTSATGVTAPSAVDNTKATFVYVDRELMDVEAVSGTTVTVIRGAESTAGRTHASGALVFIIPAYLVQFSGTPYGAPPAVPAGSCTRSTEMYLPRIQFVSGMVSDCLGGQWVTGDALTTQRQTNSGFRSPDPGGTALTALETAGTAAGASTEIYCSEVNIPYSMLLTGLGVLNGTTVGTNKHFAILYDSTGNVLANTAILGTTTAGASTYQKMNFVTKYYAVGPARYFACDGINGTTDTIRHAITAVNDNIIGGTITAQVFGTAAAVTLPTTFTTAKVPYFLLF